MDIDFQPRLDRERVIYMKANKQQRRLANSKHERIRTFRQPTNQHQTRKTISQGPTQEEEEEEEEESNLINLATGTSSPQVTYSAIPSARSLPTAGAARLINLTTTSLFLAGRPGCCHLGFSSIICSTCPSPYVARMTVTSSSLILVSTISILPHRSWTLASSTWS